MNPTAVFSENIRCSEIMMVFRQDLPPGSQTVLGRLSEEQILAALKYLHGLQYPLRSRSIQSDRQNDQVNERLSRHMGFPLTPAKIFDHARAINPVSWLWWLRRAGLPAQEIQKRTHRSIHLSINEALEAVQLLAERGIPVYASDIIQMSEPNPLLTQKFQRDMAPRDIYLDVVRLHGVSWTQFLRQAHLDDFQVRKEFFRTKHLTPTEIVQILKFFERNGDSIKAVQLQNRTEVATDFNGMVSFPVTLAKVYKDATRFHQTPWEWWKQRADKKSRSLIFISVRQILEVIRFLNTLRDYPLHVRSIERDHGNPEINRRIYAITGYELTPLKIYDQATRVHGKRWDHWLQDTGIDPNEVYRRSRNWENLSLADQNELRANYAALVPEATGVEFSGDGTVSTIPADERSGEFVLIQSQYSERLQNVSDRLSARELVLVDGLLDYFSHETEMNFNSIIYFFSSEKSLVIAHEELSGLFARLRQEPELSALFSDD
jgi:hypothetical protein